MSDAAPIRLVLLRHGQSEWNLENRFTGWTETALTPKGVEEAERAGELLAGAGFAFDLCYTSVMNRAIKTLWIVQEAMDLMWLPVVKSWRLNERHYGALQGLDKAATAKRVGEAQVHAWRRGYRVRPPQLDPRDPRFPGHDPRYAGLAPEEIPRGESLEDTLKRLLPVWEGEVVPHLKRGRRLLVVAHGNSMRALVKHLDGISDRGIERVEIPTGNPLVYVLDAQLRPVEHYYLGDEAAQARAPAARTAEE